LSTSTDDSRFIAEQLNATIIDVPDGSFNHGLTRNLGVEHTNGSLLFYTVQDAWIEDKSMLQKMVAHFNNPAIMGVVGHQAVPHEADKNPAVWFKRYTEPTIETRFERSIQK
jgi:rhamnosyltransferase